MQHDVFICHASEDKDALVRPLAEALRESNLDVWYDEFSLEIGDSLREAIDRGLSASNYGIVVLSPSFFLKPWTQRELNGLVAREMGSRQKIILPIWHEVTFGEVLLYSPPLADVRAAMSSVGIEKLARDLVRKIKPNPSPLLIARDELLRFDYSPPPISDEWWLIIVELQEQMLSPTWRRPLLFPLPGGIGAEGRERGLNIAWTALQNDWQCDAEQQQICQITHPDRAHAFINERPALAEASRAHPERLVNYLPQLLIPEFSGDFAEAFDDLLELSITEKARDSDRKRPHAQCSRSLALRHPSFGSHTPSDIAAHWLRGTGYDLSASALDEFDYLIWLCADDSAWLPQLIRDVLVSGMRTNAGWVDDLTRRGSWDSPLAKILHKKRRVPLRWTKALRDDLTKRVEQIVRKLGLNSKVTDIVGTFIAHDFIGGHDAFLDAREAARRRR
ncbi:MAG: toll/interleukin-1 receptor domain-containing protein [Caulobacter sp.]